MRRQIGSALIGLLLSAMLAVVLSACTETRYFLSPPDVRGGPVRIADASGDRVYVLTTQWRKRQLFTGGRPVSSQGRTVAQLNVDLWALDAATMRPVFRRRIREARVNDDAAAMGVDNGVMWARLPELVGIRLADGEIVADRERIAARNPALARLLPMPPAPGTFLTEQMQPLHFTADAGLVIRLDDARRVRIDPATLQASPYEPPREPSSDSAARAPLGSGRVVIESMAQGMEWRALVRGLVIDKPGGGNEWLALLADSELAQLKSRRPAVGAQMDYSEPRRHRLYRVALRPVEDFFGRRLEFGEARVLPESPDFLMAGLLTQGRPSYREEQGALWRRDPDSVFVLSRDRLGDGGRLQLARVGGPSGRPVWTTPLPLSNLGGWLPGERHAVMIGPAPGLQQPAGAEENENAPMHLISADLDTGALKDFDLGQNRAMPAIGAKDPS